MTQFVEINDYISDMMFSLDPLEKIKTYRRNVEGVITLNSGKVSRFEDGGKAKCSGAIKAELGLHDSNIPAIDNALRKMRDDKSQSETFEWELNTPFEKGYITREDFNWIRERTTVFDQQSVMEMDHLKTFHDGADKGLDTDMFLDGYHCIAYSRGSSSEILDAFTVKGDTIVTEYAYVHQISSQQFNYITE